MNSKMEMWEWEVDFLVDFPATTRLVACRVCVCVCASWERGPVLVRPSWQYGKVSVARRDWTLNS